MLQWKLLQVHYSASICYMVHTNVPIFNGDNDTMPIRYAMTITNLSLDLILYQVHPYIFHIS